MSILAAGDSQGVRSLIILLLLACISIAGAAWAGVFAARSVERPLDIEPGRDARALLLVIFAGATAWILTQMFYGTVRQTMLARTHGAGYHFAEKNFAPADWAFLATVPAVAGFIVLLAGDFGVGGPTMPGRLGFAPGKFFRGVAMGLIGILITLPLVIAVSSVTESVYQLLHFAHPTEPDLLREMGGPSPLIRLLLIGGATVCAPFFEEWFFRGHLQTYLRAMLVGWTTRPIPTTTPGFEVVGVESSMPPPFAASTPPSVAVQTWISIVLTSVLFSLVHAAWMWPPIFCLSVCLGFARERTGNIWTCITMHALFNGFETFAYLSTQHK